MPVQNHPLSPILHTRLREVMAHTSRYAFKGEARLAADAGVSKSAINRLINKKASSTYWVVLAVTQALEKVLKRSFDPRELVSLDGAYPTGSTCKLVGCRGCQPSEAYDEKGNVRPDFRHLKPGEWALFPSSRDGPRK